MSDSDKKWHWYLFYVSWQVRGGGRSTSGTNSLRVPLENQNINEKVMEEVGLFKRKEIVAEYGESVEHGIQILSISYLGYMTYAEFYGDNKEVQ